MKYKKMVRRLIKRQEVWENETRRDAKLAASTTKPGSPKKG